MMLNFLAGPLVGGVIGYITNSLAIRMLFRPYKPIYLGGIKLPFTPGLIPKEKARIAKSIGGVVSGELLNNEVFTETLTSQRMQERLGNWLDRQWERGRNSDKTLREKLYQLTEKETMDGIVQDANTELAALIGDKLKNFNFGEEIARQGIWKLRDKYTEEMSFKSMLAHMLDDSMIDALAEPLGRQIDALVSENSEQIVSTVLEQEVDKLLDTPISELAERFSEKQPAIRQALVDGYCRIVRKDLPKMLAAVNLAEVVQERINAYEMADLEKLIRDIMNRELRAIVWLGALLGFLMGFVTSWLSLM